MAYQMFVYQKVKTTSDASVSLSKQQPRNHIKQENSGHVEVESDNESCCRQDNELFDQNIEETNGTRSKKTVTEDLVDKKINEKLASFIQFLMTNRQPDNRFKTLYNGTHRPANVPALGGFQLNSAVNGVLQKEGNEAVDKLAYTQNCMLKGVTKTAL